MTVEPLEPSADARPRRDLPFTGRWRLPEPGVIPGLVDWQQEAIAAEALHAGRFNRVGYSRAARWYANAGDYLPRGLGYRTITRSVDSMDGDSLGYLRHNKVKPGSKNRWQSSFAASDLLLAVGDRLRIRCTKPRDPVLLRDKNKHLVAFDETDFTSAITRNIAEIDEALASVRVDLDPETPCLWRCGDFLEVADRNGDPYSIHLAHVPLCRIFNGDWNSGGRFIGLPCQNWPKGVRPYITLDGEPTEELDFGQTHLRMLCARCELNIEANDLFDIPGFDRDLVKRVFYILINAPTLRSALLAASDDRPRRKKGTYAKVEAIVEAIKDRFPPLAPYLHTGAGLGLMRLESDIAESVLINLTRRGIPALPIHHSFIVEAKNAPILEEAMAASWGKFVGSPAVVSWKKKPSVPADLQ